MRLNAAAIAVDDGIIRRLRLLSFLSPEIRTDLIDQRAGLRLRLQSVLRGGQRGFLWLLWGLPVDNRSPPGAEAKVARTIVKGHPGLADVDEDGLSHLHLRRDGDSQVRELDLLGGNDFALVIEDLGEVILDKNTFHHLPRVEMGVPHTVSRLA